MTRDEVRASLRAALEKRWRRVAPKRMVKAFDDA